MFCFCYPLKKYNIHAQKCYEEKIWENQKKKITHNSATLSKIVSCLKYVKKISKNKLY